MSDETQYNNVMNIISNYPNMPASMLNEKELSEKNVMAAIFSNTFLPANMKQKFLKYSQVDIYGNMENKTVFYDIDMNITGGNPKEIKNIVDLDISYYNKSDIIKYYFLIDLLSEFYGYLIQNEARDSITIKSRYILKNDEWKLYDRGYFTFDINYKYNAIDGVTHFKIGNVSDESSTAVENMCDIFMRDILRHLNYINKVDILSRNETYLINLQAFYKSCRLKLIYYTFQCCAEISGTENEFIKLALSNCFLNLKNLVVITNNDSKSIILTNKLITTRKAVAELTERARKNEDKIKRHQKLSNALKDNYLKQIMYVICAITIAIIVIIFISNGLSKSNEFVSMTIVLSAIIVYVLTHYIVQMNYVEYVENFESSKLYRYPKAAATANFFPDNEENVTILIKESSKTNNNTAGWRVFDRNPNTYWETQVNTFKKPQKKWTKTVCTTSRSVTYAVTSERPGHEKSGCMGNKPVRTEHVDTLTNKPYVLDTCLRRFFSPWTTSCASSSITSSLDTEFSTEKTPGYGNNNRGSTITYVLNSAQEDLLYSYAKTTPPYLLFDMGKPITISSYSIKFVEKETAPKSFRLIGTNDEQILNINEVYGTYHSTIDLADIDAYSDLNDFKIFRASLNKSKEPIYSYDHVPLDGVENQVIPVEKKVKYTHKYLKFTETDSTYIIDILDNIELDVLVVGGGGSGGTRNGGGGGAGACIYLKKQAFKRGKYSIRIGKGGDSIPAGPASAGNNGEDSTITNLDTGEVMYLAKGGGGGGGGISSDQNIKGFSGGSCGGSAINNSVAVPQISNENIPSGSYGKQGGYGNYGTYNKFNVPGAGGGGGGAGGIGKNSVVNSFNGSQVSPGNGGEGVDIDITGANIKYCGGGGGGSSDINVTVFTPSIGGDYIGGKGGNGMEKGKEIEVFLNTFHNYNTLNPTALWYVKYVDYQKRFYKFITPLETNTQSALQSSVGKYIYIYQHIDYEYDKVYSLSLVRYLEIEGSTFKYVGFSILDGYGDDQKIRLSKEIDYVSNNVNGYMQKPWTLPPLKKQDVGVNKDSIKPNNKTNNIVIVSTKTTIANALDAAPSTGSGGGGGGILRDTTENEESANNASHNSASGAGGSGIVILKYKIIPNMEYMLRTEYQYYALVVDKLLGLGNRLKIAEIEFTRQPYDNTINTITQYYDKMLQPQVEIVGAAKEAKDAADAELKRKQDLVISNAAALQALRDRLANIGNGDFDMTEITSNNNAAEYWESIIQGLENDIAAEDAKQQGYIAHSADMNYQKAQIELDNQQLQSQINALSSIQSQIEQLKSQMDSSVIDNELNLLNSSNLQVSALLSQSKIKETSDKILLASEQRLFDEYGFQLADIQSRVSQTRQLESVANERVSFLQNAISQATEAEIALATQYAARIESERIRDEQIAFTETARVNAEAQKEIENERRQFLQDQQAALNILQNQIDADSANITILNRRIVELQEAINNVDQYTQDYLQNSSNEFDRLQLERDLEKQQLLLDIANLQASINVFKTQSVNDIRDIIAYRAANVNIQRELDEVSSQVNAWKISADNYAFASTNVLSIDNSIKDVQTKISLNMESTMTTIANSIVVSAYERDYKDVSEKNELNTLVAAKSKDDVQEQKRNNKITVATIKLILNILLLTIFLMIVHSKLSLTNMVYAIVIAFIIIFVLYAIEIIRIVHTKSDNYYWKKPDVNKLK